MRRFNLQNPELEYDADDPAGYRAGMARFGPQLTNRTGEPVRVLMISTMHEPAAAVYPDSDKIGLWPGDKRDHILVRRESGVDYWDGEA